MAADSLFARPQYGLCRAITGHSWEFVRKVLIVTADDALLRLRCGRCETERHDRVSLKTGAVNGRVYKHPKDYRLQLAADERAPKKAEQRRAALSTLRQERGTE
jgi:hypothetical protein